MLRTALNMHPSVVAKTEMFNPDWTAGEPFDDSAPAQAVLDGHIFCTYPPHVAAVGFILHRSGARFGHWPRLWQLLEEDVELHIISLRRQNLLLRYLSYQAMRDRQRNRPRIARYLDPVELREEFEKQEQELAEFDQRFGGHPLIKVSYEQLCSDYSATMRRLQVFIGAPFAPIIPGTRRNAPSPLRQSVANLDELIESFAASRWSWFFREAPPGAGFQARLAVEI